MGFGAFFATAYTGEKVDQDNDGVYLLIGVGGLAVGTALGVWLTGEYLAEPSENRNETFHAALGGAVMGAAPATVLYAYGLSEADYGYSESLVVFIPFVVAAPAPVSAFFYNIVKKPKRKRSDPAVCVRPAVTLSGGESVSSRLTPLVGVSVCF